VVNSSVIWILVANALFTLGIGLSGGGPFMAMIAHDSWSLTDPQVQQLTAIGSITAVVGVWLGGKADRWGAKRMWVATAFACAVSLAGWGLARDAVTGTIFIMVNMLFTEALFITSETLLADHTTRSARSFLFGLQGTTGGISEAAGPVLGTALIPVARLSGPFIAGALATALCLLLILPVGGPRLADHVQARAAE
jgi:hypothetical protein